MKMEITKGLRGWFLVLLAVVPLAFLAGCGADGAAGADGQDLINKTALTSGSYSTDIVPLFNANDQYFDGSLSCAKCHFDNTTASGHMMDLSTYNGILIGADAGEEDIMGRTGSCVGSTDTTTCPPDWGASGLRARLRNNRMPPNWPFDYTQGNRGTVEIRAMEALVRDGPLQVGTAALVGWDTLISTLRTAACTVTGTPDVITTGEIVLTGVAPAKFTGGCASEAAVDWHSSNWGASATAKVGDLFTKDAIYFEGSEACSNCHNGLSWSAHEMDLSNVTGLLGGADGGIEDILGRKNGSGAGQCANTTVIVTTTGDGNTCAPEWGESGLRGRMRNSRMPPGWEFQLGQTNRDMWAIDTIGCWVTAGAPNGAFDCPTY